DMITGTAQTHHRGEDRRHARSRGHRLLCPLQRRNALLEGANRWVHVAGVDVALLLTGKARGGFAGAAKYVTGRQKQRFAVFRLRPARLAGAHRQGVESGLIQVAVQPPRLPFETHFTSPPSLCSPITALSTLTIALAAS